MRALKKRRQRQNRCYRQVDSKRGYGRHREIGQQLFNCLISLNRLIMSQEAFPTIFSKNWPMDFHDIPVTRVSIAARQLKLTISKITVERSQRKSTLGADLFSVISLTPQPAMTILILLIKCQIHPTAYTDVAKRSSRAWSFFIVVFCQVHIRANDSRLSYIVHHRIDLADTLIQIATCRCSGNKIWKSFI